MAQGNAKGIIIIGTIVVLGAGAATLMVRQHRQHAAPEPQPVTSTTAQQQKNTAAVPPAGQQPPAAGTSTGLVQFVSVNPTPAEKQDGQVAGDFVQAVLQPNASVDATMSSFDDVVVREETGKSLQQSMTPKDKQQAAEEFQKEYAKFGPVQQVQVVSIQPSTVAGMTFKRLNVICTCAHGTWKGYFDFNQQNKIVNNSIFN